MSHNSFGHLFRFTTWGESHGPSIGCVVDGCPPRLALSEAIIQPWLDDPFRDYDIDPEMICATGRVLAVGRGCL